MAKEVSDVVVIEGTLRRDSLGNLIISQTNSNPFSETGYYHQNNKNKLAENAIVNGYQEGDKVRYICILQKE